MPETNNGGRNTAGRRRNPLRDPRDRRLNRIAGPSSLVLFGVTGDLARKKLMPAVYDLANRGLLPPSFALVGFARRQWENEDFAAEVLESVKAYARTPFDETVWKQLSEGIRFVQGEFDDDDAFKRLSEAEIAAYLRTGEWHGKAGGYAVQGRAASLIRWVCGSYSNVVGLPLFETVQLLAGRGYRPSWIANC